MFISALPWVKWSSTFSDIGSEFCFINGMFARYSKIQNTLVEIVRWLEYFHLYTVHISHQVNLISIIYFFKLRNFPCKYQSKPKKKFKEFQTHDFGCCSVTNNYLIIFKYQRSNHNIFITLQFLDLEITSISLCIRIFLN